MKEGNGDCRGGKINEREEIPAHATVVHKEKEELNKTIIYLF